MSSNIKYYHHGRFRVQGGVLPDAITAYETFGDPSNPCIVFPTCYGGKLDGEQALPLIEPYTGQFEGSGLLDQSYLVGKGKVRDHDYSLQKQLSKMK